MNAFQDAPLAQQTKRRPPHRDLVVWMAEEDISVKELAARVGCSAIYMSQIRMGVKTPGRVFAVAIERETAGRIKVADWGAK